VHAAEKRLPPVTGATDVRDAFFETLYALATEDRRVIVLSDDQSAMTLAKFEKHLPGQYYNIGVAEQNMVSVAAGLAVAGKRPVLYGITPFVTLRCYEQIRNDVCCPRLPVTIVGSGPGYMYSGDGPTHHATTDLAVMRALPDLTILSPADAITTAAACVLAYDNAGPTYVRLEKGAFPALHADDHDFRRGLARLVEGRGPLLVATGIMVHRAIEVAKQLAAHGVGAGVLDLYRIKPVDAGALLAHLRAAPAVVTIEETSIVGGLGSLVAELVVDAGLRVPVKRIAGPDAHLYAYGPRDWVHAQCGLDTDAIVRTILAWPERTC
jgi:transketolase